MMQHLASCSELYEDKDFTWEWKQLWLHNRGKHWPQGIATGIQQIANETIPYKETRLDLTVYSINYSFKDYKSHRHDQEVK